MEFEEWDRRELVIARQKLWKVYEDIYGSPDMRKAVKRLGTIILKLDELIYGEEPKHG